MELYFMLDSREKPDKKRDFVINANGKFFVYVSKPNSAVGRKILDMYGIPRVDSPILIEEWPTDMTYSILKGDNLVGVRKKEYLDYNSFINTTRGFIGKRGDTLYFRGFVATKIAGDRYKYRGRVSLSALWPLLYAPLNIVEWLPRKMILWDTDNAIVPYEVDSIVELAPKSLSVVAVKVGNKVHIREMLIGAIDLTYNIETNTFENVRAFPLHIAEQVGFSIDTFRANKSITFVDARNGFVYVVDDYDYKRYPIVEVVRV